jgi:hypothetical protein
MKNFWGELALSAVMAVFIGWAIIWLAKTYAKTYLNWWGEHP